MRACLIEKKSDKNGDPNCRQREKVIVVDQLMGAA